ncbi:MAG: BrnA antitoxin family protein [Holosporaceae bacterium]|jgi:uncharacterized protein (DUF4415 family)|nr:BrnA antitoxin family protein [Holosporaceae bacterium]
MATTRITIETGQKPTEAQLKEIREAAKAPATYDPDCPPSSPQALAEFAAKARALRQAKKRLKPTVTIRLAPECLDAYRALGKGYTGIMADVLTYAAGRPDILKQAVL